jgi:hypothetical protein
MLSLPFGARQVLGLLVAGIVLASLILVSLFKPFVPDYDGLAYYGWADIIRQWLMGEGDGKFTLKGSEYSARFWPITNGPGVYFVALFGDLLDKNLAPAFLHGFYLLVGAFYIQRLRGTWYALGMVALLCGNSFFFRLFTSLTSDFGVGVWLMAFMATVAGEQAGRRRALWVLVPIGISLRTVDAAFIISIAGAYVLAEIVLYRRYSSVKSSLVEFGLPLFLTAAVLSSQFLMAFDYVRSTTFGVSADAWKSVGGVATRMDVVERYLEFMQLYHGWILYALVLAVVGVAFLRGESRRDAMRSIVIAGAVMAPLVTAGALHIQVAFWVYVAIIFMILEVARHLLMSSSFGGRKTLVISIAGLALGASFLVMLADSWRRESRYLGQLSEYSELNETMLGVVRKGADVSYVATNYVGIGTISTAGISLALGRRLEDGNVRNVYTKGMPVDHYFDFDDRVNLFVAAHQDYNFPPHFGINEKTAEMAARFPAEAGELGFRHVAEVSERGRFFDIWYRPGLLVFPEFIAHGDKWIAGGLPLQLGSSALCGESRISGAITLDLMFPSVPDVPEFRPPFEMRLVDAKGATVARSIVETAGTHKVDVPLANVACGNYRMVFNQSFTTAHDARGLSALLQGQSASLKFDQKKYP